MNSQFSILNSQFSILNLLAIIAIIFSPAWNILNGQGKLFNTESISNLNLSSAENNKLEFLIRRGDYLKISPISLNIATNAIENESFVIQLPEIFQNGIQVKMPIHTFEFNGPNDYYIYTPPAGLVITDGPDTDPEGPCSGARSDGHSMMLFNDGNGVNGNIVVNEKRYIVRSFSTDKTFLIELAPSKNPKTCGVDHGRDNASVEEELLNINSRPTKITERGAYCEEIRLVTIRTYYTKKAEEQCMNIEELAKMKIRQSNQALENSGIENFRFAIRGAQPLFDFVEDSKVNMGEDLVVFKNHFKVQNGRDLNAADLVSLFVGDEYEDATGVSDLFTFGDSEYGFAFMQVVSERDGPYIFQHELFHNFGCRHERSQIFGDPDLGFVFNTPLENSFATSLFPNGSEDRLGSVVAETAVTEDQFLSLSYPNAAFFHEGNLVSSNEDPQADNVLQVQTWAKTISLYRGEDQILFNGLISGPGTVAGGTHSWELDVCGCEKYFISWYQSTNGVNYSVIPGYYNGNFDRLDNFTMPPHGQDLYLKVRIRCSDGRVLYTYFHVFNILPCDENKIDPINRNDQTLTLAMNDNIVDGPRFISFSNKRIDDIKISINGINGNNRQIFDQKIEAGQHSILLDPSYLAPGIYILQAQSSSDSRIVKFIIY